ncbi:MAG: response regulator [Spirochaetaceae bacterium]|jgi:PAS domain S-box-containing protein|nr:response regulator [Spirochaetaceae bacterium]
MAEGQTGVLPGSLRRAEWEKQGQYLELLLENSPDVILLLDAEGCFVSCSRVCLELAGVEDFSLIKGKTFAEVFSIFGNKLFLVQSQEWFNRVRADHKTITENVRIDFSGKGKFRNYTINSTSLQDGEGNFDGALMIYHDITDLLRAEADERTRVMFDAIPLACTFWDAGGKLLDCNQEALNLFEVPGKEEFLERFEEFSPVLQPDGSVSRDRIREDIQEAYRSGRREFGWLHRSATGKDIPSDVILVRVAFRDGYRVVGYTRDLRYIQVLEDKRRKADERSRELEVQTRAAQVASEAKSKFLASMSHEIRTPMNAIIGLSDLMRTDNLDGEQQAFFSDIKKMSKALLQIINDILDISKIEIGKMEFLSVHFNLHELYDNICSLSRFTAESKDLEFRQSFDPAVPTIIYGDDVRIRQVITNIINNAVKYTKEGYVDFAVKRIEQHGKSYIAFIVRDSGVGIREEDFPKLFGNFQQLDRSSNRGIQGTGLGLAITKNLVTMMNGEIRFKSEYGRGSEFTILLPLIEGRADLVEQKHLNVRIMAGDDVRVLVVDDNHINLKVAQAFLAKHNIRADTAGGGDEAVTKAGSNAYDIIFMDHMMPGVDGVEATRRIRSLNNDWCQKVPIVALTANAVSGAREMFLAAGMNDFISKPIDAADLNRKLEKWLPRQKIRLAGEKSPSGEPAGDKGKPAGGDGDSAAENRTDGNAGEKEAVPVLDYVGGLKNACGDSGLYRKLLRDFRNAHGADYGLIKAAIEGGRYGEAHRLAHTLKSTAALIGAFRLRGIAWDIERAFAEENSGSVVSRLPELEAEMQVLLNKLAGPAGMPESAVPSPAEGAAVTGGDAEVGDQDVEAAASLADKLIPMLRSGNTAVLDMTGELRKVFADPGGRGELLAGQIEDFEFDQALKTLLDIKEGIGKGIPGDW